MFDRRRFMIGVGSFVAVAPVSGALWAEEPAQQQEPSGAPEAETTEELLKRLELEGSEGLGPMGNCAQTTFGVLNRHFGLAGDDYYRGLSGFPGIGVRGETCGAVTGALLALGMALGADPGAEPQERLPAYKASRTFAERFEEVQGSTMCRNIQTAATGRWHDLAIPAEAQAFQEAGGKAGCQSAVASGVRIAAQLILDSKQA
jgi:C_GCAxxG_C_C family probable redox protein